MAMTASVALSSSSGTLRNAIVNAVLTVSNSSATAVNVLGIQPVAQVTGTLLRSVPCDIGACGTGPGVTVAVPASGSITFPFSVAIPSPQAATLTSGTSQAYDIGANVLCSDGSFIAASVATYTLTAPLT